MMLVKFGSSTWINPEDVSSVTAHSGGHASTIELRSGTRFHVSETPREAAAKLMAASE